ncbi:MAG: sterol-binding protein [Betaproteobacteria bacterium]|nr:sterol-binding protein [Betaproteobacteria bacterium]
MSSAFSTAEPQAAAPFALESVAQAALRRLAALLDHLVEQQPQGRGRLLAHAGKSLQLRIGAAAMRLSVGEHGELVAAPASDAAPALQLDVDLVRWVSAQLRGGPEAALGGVRIAGDAEFAQAVSWLLGHVRWDAEADLARVFGAVIAHRAVRSARDAGTRARGLASRLESDAREWLREAPRGVVGRWEIDGVAGDLARLRDAAARLEKRVGALRRRLGA